MKIIAFEKKIINGTVRLTGHVKRRSGDVDLFFEYPEQFSPLVVENADPFVAALLLPAMANEEELEIVPSVSQRLWCNLPRIQEIFNSWYPDVLKPIPVHADYFHGAGPAKGSTGAFFSLGVDSFHTLLRHEKEFPGREKITHLIYMMGFEVPLREYKDGRERSVIEDVQKVACIWGKKAICGRTNLRDCFSLDWPRQYHGSALAATALSLSAGLGRVLIPASVSWTHLVPWGSHLITDPLWSSDDLEIIHDGIGADRARKIADTVIHYPEALRRLRVCTNKRGGAGNCGFCPKCIRTMITLEIAGSLQSCRSFPSNLPHDFWRRMEFKIIAIEANLRFAREKKAPSWIIKGLERALALSQLETLRKKRGDWGFTFDLFRLAFEKTIGRIILYPDRRRRKRIRPRKEHQ